MHILNYLDNWLILVHLQQMLVSHMHALLGHLKLLGLCVNMQKIVLKTSQSITNLGVFFDSLEMCVHLFQERRVVISPNLCL